REKWSIVGHVYSENDVKNQPMQQNLSPVQAQILVNAGDNTDLMTSPSAYLDTYSENNILYRKTLVSGVEVFELSNDHEAYLYNIRFTLVGNNQGNYILASNAAVGRIYEYIPPANGVMQGNYEAVVRLVAPTKIQIATLSGKYSPGIKTYVDFEVGFSNNDLNLFSNVADNDNQGLAGKFNGRQKLFDGKWSIDAFADFQFVQKNFRTIERLFSIEFDRDWNLTNPIGNQSLLISGLNFKLADKGNAKYQFEKLDFSESFSGSRHVLQALFKFDKLSLQNNGSYLNSDGSYAESEFIRNNTQARYHFQKNWVGATVRLEDNKELIKSTGLLSPLSQRFTEIGAFV